MTFGRGSKLDNLHASADTSDDSDGNGQQNVGSNVLHELAPLGAVVGGVVQVVRTGVAVHTLQLAHGLGLTVAGLVGTQAGELLHRGCLHAAYPAGARLRLALLAALGIGDTNVTNHQTAIGCLDNLDLDVGEPIDEDIADLDNLEVELVQLHVVLLVLGDSGGAKSESKGELVLMVPHVARSHHLMVWLGVVLKLGAQSAGHGIGVGVKLEAVQQQTIGVGGVVYAEVQLQVAWDIGGS